MKGIGVIAALAVLLCVALSAVAGPAAWTSQGPFGGGIDRIVVDPDVPSRLYASTNQGFFRSVDSGLSWQRAENGLLQPQPQAALIALDPNVAGALWLVDNYSRLYRSTDGAKHWKPTGDDVANVARVTSLSAARGAPGVLYEAARGLGVRKSIDGGATFTTLGGGLAGTEYLQVAVDPGNPLHVLAMTRTDCDPGSPPSPIYRSTDAGASWTAIVPTGGCIQVFDTVPFAFGPPGSDRVYAVAWGSLLRSDDGGASFSQTFMGHDVGAVSVSPASADVLWLGGRVSPFFMHTLSPMKSVDGGVTATLLATGLAANGSAIPSAASFAIHPDYPGTPRVWLGTPNAGVYHSSNDGGLWTATNDGLAATSIRALAVNPLHGSRMYAGSAAGVADPSPAFYRSNTIGGWVASNAGLDAYLLRSIVIDPTTASSVGATVIYAVGYGEDWAAGEPVGNNGGIYKSVDGGLTWSTLSGGLPTTPSGPSVNGQKVRAIVLDPRSCASPPPSGPCTSGPLQTAYAAGTGMQIGGSHQWRIMKTTDGGATWASSENGLPPDGDPGSNMVTGVVPLIIDPVHPQTLYAGTATLPGHSRPTPMLPNGVFKSIDGGANWIQKSVGLPRYPGSTDSALDVLALAIDPVNPQTLWASTVNFPVEDVPGQIYKSTDGAEHWTLSNAGVTASDTRALLVDSSNPSIVYAASAGSGPANPGGVYKSVDGGANWTSISIGLPARSALALALDPDDSRVLHAGTSGGVYTITQLADDDQDGVPDLIENSGPNGGDADNNGTLDSRESNVSTTALGLLDNSLAWQNGVGNSVQAQIADLNRVLASNATGDYFTVKIISGDCTYNVDVAPVDAAPLARDSVAHHGSFDFPRGLVRFELPECTHATVDVIFNGANFGDDWSWRYYGPSTPGDSTTMGWHDASSIVDRHTATTWRLHLATGQFGSYRPTTANSILFVGGPGSNDTLFTDGFDG